MIIFLVIEHYDGPVYEDQTVKGLNLGFAMSTTGFSSERRPTSKPAKLRGKTTVKKVPVGGRRVYLFRSGDLGFLAVTTSDPVTGDYVFENIDPFGEYCVLSVDDTRTYDAVAHSFVIGE